MDNNEEKGVILIVDDEAELTKTLKGFFMALGYDMLTAFNGDEAVKIIDSIRNIDLILLDIRMPGVDGITILNKVRKERPKTKVIVITAYDKETKSAVEEIGINGFLAKPIDISKLLDRIKYVLKEADSQTRFFPSKETGTLKPAGIPKARILFLEPNPMAFAFMCVYFAEENFAGNYSEDGIIKGEYEIRVVYGDKDGLNLLYDYQPDIVIMNENLFSIEDTKELAGLMMKSSHKPKALILHGLLPKTDYELLELKKMGIEFCNQNSIDDKAFRELNKRLADFVAQECVKNGLINPANR